MPTAWLVERTVDDRGLVALVYATEDGTRVLCRERSPRVREAVTAAVEADAGDLETVDPGNRERYRREAERMADRHDPDGEV
jgi:hypothetical protein